MRKTLSGQETKEIRMMADAAAEAMMDVVKASQARLQKRLEAKARK